MGFLSTCSPFHSLFSALKPHQLEAYADDVIADPSVLEVLDLRSYAEELERRQRGRKGTILAMIKRELTRVRFFFLCVYVCVSLCDLLSSPYT